MNNGIATTPHEQSQRLLACGVPADTADMAYATNDDILLTAPYAEMRDRFKETNCIPAWSLNALFSIILNFLNTEAKEYRFQNHIRNDDKSWEFEAEYNTNKLEYHYARVSSLDLIEACVLMVEKLHANATS